MMFSSAVLCGKRLKLWNTIPIFCHTLFTFVFGSVMSMPSMMIVPRCMGSSAFIQRSMVDLPEPEGPITTTTSLLVICRSMPRSTSSCPKLLCTFWSSIMTSTVMLHLLQGLRLWGAGPRVHRISARGLAGGRACGPDPLGSAALLRLKPRSQSDERDSEDHVYEGGDHEGGGVRHHPHLLFRREEQLLHRDHRRERGVFDQGDERVGERRDDDLDGLWQDDVAHGLSVGHPERARGLHLSAVYRFDPRAEHLRRVRGIGGGEGEHGGRYRGQDEEAQSRGRSHDGQARVDEHEVEEQGQAPEEVDVCAGEPAEDTQAREPQEGEDEPGDEGEEHAEAQQLPYDRQRAEKDREGLLDDAPIEVVVLERFEAVQE